MKYVIARFYVNHFVQPENPKDGNARNIHLPDRYISYGFSISTKDGSEMPELSSVLPSVSVAMKFNVSTKEEQSGDFYYSVFTKEIHQDNLVDCLRVAKYLNEHFGRKFVVGKIEVAEGKTYTGSELALKEWLN